VTVKYEFQTVRSFQAYCPGLLVSIWQCTDVSGRRLTVSSSLMSACTNSAGPTQQCVLFDVDTAASAMAVLQLLDQNSLPIKLRQCDTVGEFKQLLQTHLFVATAHCDI